MMSTSKALAAALLVLSVAAAWAAGAPTQDKSGDEPPKINPSTPPGPVPEGMVWIPGGEFWMGLEEKDFAPPYLSDARPVHKVYVDGFWMDKTEVTNQEFARFVRATGYKTVAEIEPDPKDFPNVPPDKLKAFSIVFQVPKKKVELKNLLAWWKIEYGASWQHPEGPDTQIQGREKHPVVQVCWRDAVAYCKWAKKRLPTEAEWEFAARGGLDRKKYCWGDELLREGKWQANVWQGEFPYKDKGEDGFAGTAPVASFPPNGYGVYDMSGNAWEWCADWYAPDYYKQSPLKNPQGPKKSVDPGEPGVPKRVQRGGAFLCADSYCRRYMPGARGKGEPDSAANHIGFRCVKDAK